MRKSIKWTFIGLGIFIGVVIVAVIVIFVGLFISTGVLTFKEVFTPETKQVEQAEEEVTTEEEVPKVKSEGLQELITGQEFIYDGKKIVLTKYEIEEADTDKNLLWVYLYVENIDNVPHVHIYDMDFTIYHNGREDGGLLGFGLPGLRKYYSTGEYRELYPGEVCEGWIDSFIPIDWKAEDIEIHFKPDLGLYTPCIWKLESPKEVSPEAKTKKEAEAKDEHLTLGQAIEYEGLKASVIKYEFAEWIKTTDEPIYPDKGGKFLWIWVKVENIGEVKTDLFRRDCFYILYKGSEFGDNNRSEYCSVDHQLYFPDEVYPGVGDEGWILYVLPESAKVEDITVKLYSQGIFPTEVCIWKLEE